MRFTALAAGFGACVCQVALFREARSLFQGDELMAGAIFMAWMLCSASGVYFFRRCRGSETVLKKRIVSLLIAFAVSAPLSFVGLRTAGVVSALGAGESFTLLRAIPTSLICCLVPCLSLGGIFSLVWQVLAANREANRSPVYVYIFESVGAALGGIFVQFLAIPFFSVFTALFTASMVSAASALFVSRSMVCRHNPLIGTVFPWILIALSSIGITQQAVIEGITRTWRFGDSFASALDTPYNDVTLLTRGKQSDFLLSGVWAFSIPDPLSAELSIHPAMLAHPNPARVLLLGGITPQSAAEALKHPQVTELDAVERDPGLYAFIRDALPPGTAFPENDARFGVVYDDAANYLRKTAKKYDVIIMNAGEPHNAGMNRFYTLEFFRTVKNALSRDGLFHFGISVAPEGLGQAEIAYVQSFYATLKGVFPEISMRLGTRAEFFAVNGAVIADNTPARFMSGLEQRGISAEYLSETYIFDALSPARLAYVDALLKDAGVVSETRMNRDFEPKCYLNNLLTYAARHSPEMRKWFFRAFGIPKAWVVIFLAFTVMISGGLVLRNKNRPINSIYCCMFITGGTLIVLSACILLALQVVAGSMHGKSALVIGLFMSGCALGAAGCELLPKGESRRQLMASMLVLTLLTLCLPLVFEIVHARVVKGAMDPGGFASTAVFTGLSMLAGIIGGGIFSLSRRGLGEVLPGEDKGIILYVLDLSGAAVFAPVAAFYLLPVYGLNFVLFCTSAFLSMALFCLFAGSGDKIVAKLQIT